MPANLKKRRKGRKDVAQRRLDERLDIFLRAHDIQAGRVPVGPSVRSPRRLPEMDTQSPARGSATNPTPHHAPPPSPQNPRPPSPSPPGRAQSVSSSPVPPEADTGGFGDQDISEPTTASQHGHPDLGAVPLESMDPDPLEGLDLDGNAASIQLPKLQTTQSFIDLIRVAVLEGSGMQDDDIVSLREPGPDRELLNPSPLLRSVRHFVNNDQSSREHYETLRKIELLHNPGDPMLSFDQVKCRIRWLSGVVPLEHDMCTNSCVAYTGPYSDLEKCPWCSETRYILGSTVKARKRFTTIPIGPVIQAFYGSREVAQSMHYLEKQLAENLDTANANSGRLVVYDDTACGQELLDAWSKGHFRKSDVALQFSIDGAQLRRDKPSEAWVFIWVIHNLPPEMRYKKSFIIPGAIVPGPSKPGDLDSFLFPSLYHVAALQREGLRVYDAYLDMVVPRTTPFVLFGTADSLGSAAMSGMVGHSGQYGCRLYCDMPGRRRKRESHYYPVMNKPSICTVPECSHADVSADDLVSYRQGLPGKYSDNIKCLLASDTQKTFRERRLEFGLCKQTLFSGLPRQLLRVPSIFTMDIMHLSVLNDPDLFMKLFTGKLDVFEPDNRDTWDWAVFYKNNVLWSAHGESVSLSVPFLPSSFGRAPRDPAKRLNSGYKAWEFQMYLYGLGPTLFRLLLPEKYWINYCKLVSGVRLLQRHHISREDLLKGHQTLMDFVYEFEDLYYQRKESRIHFVRQSIHMLTHIAPETIRAGPLSCYAQWTLETAIGNLGREIRQDRDLYANLTQRAILRAQINSLRARFPEIQLEFNDPASSSITSNACVFENYKGYVFLPHRETQPTPLAEDELVALLVYWQKQGWPNQHTWENAVCRWAKLQLPNGQRARSVWFESNVRSASVRRASCVEVRNMFTISALIQLVLGLDRIQGSDANCQCVVLPVSVLRRCTVPSGHGDPFLYTG